MPGESTEQDPAMPTESIYGPPQGGCSDGLDGDDQFDIQEQPETATPAREELSIEDIAETLRHLHAPGEVFEIRAFIENKTYHGYFDNPEEAARYIVGQDKRRRFDGVYHTLNGIPAAIISRKSNTFSPTWKDPTTSDKDVERYQWLPIDVDTETPVSGISATEEEKHHSVELAQKIKEYLTSCGWPAPIEADSGNGAHLLYRIDLPNTPDNVVVVKSVLEAIDKKFKTDGASVDTSVYNASRILKIYGTWVRKGTHSNERPHRIARLLEVPTDVCTVTVEQLREIVDRISSEQQPEQRQSDASTRVTGNLDLKEWIAKYGENIKTTFTERAKPEYKYFFEMSPCPFDPSHPAGAYVCQIPNGAIKAACQHTHCGGREQRWDELRAMGGDKQPEPPKHDDLQPPEPITPFVEPKIDLSGLDHNLIRLMYDHQCDKIDGYTEYQLITALASVAAMVDRNADIETLHGVTYTNLFCLLIGKTTISGKTSAIDEITHYIKEIDPDLPVSNAPGSHVGFFEQLADPTRLTEDRKGHGILLVDEAITFFKLLQTPLFAELRGWLLKLWDCAPLYRSLASNKKSGKKIEFSIDKPYLNIVLGIQPDVLAETTTKLDVYSGLFPRFLVSYHTYNRRLKPTRQWSQKQKSTYMEIKTRLKYIHNFFNAHRIHFLLSISASTKLDDWVIGAITKAQNEKDDVLLALYGRARQQVFKIAMLLQISQNGFLESLLSGNDKQRTFDDVFIDDEYVELAIRLYEEYFIPCSLNAMQLIGLDQTKPVEMIKRALMRAEGHTLDGRRLTHAVGLGKRYFNDAIEQMVEHGLIITETRKNRRGRDTKLYTLIADSEA